ncbi:CoA transferase [Streptomyces sp. AC495_CC817]|uniref:CoA transferase n=1 Tax=Streptomyces sp. AC495_CC817 TaxID=2823900 RepID=UPI001C27DA95|nr:CoA transferase [Streptomyces sp. AC495_CC817]
MSSTSPSAPAALLLHRVLDEVGAGDRLEPPSPALRVPLPSRLDTGGLAWASVAAVASTAGIRGPLDPDRIALSYRSDRVLEVDGAAPSVWSPLSGFWRTSDGWVRTHGNYPHHAERLLRGLDIASHPERLGDALSERTTAEAVHAVNSVGGLIAEVSRETPLRDAALRETPVVDVRALAATVGDLPRRGSLPLEGIRVLDFTRVIAGPVCTRTLALLGADVLRIDPPGLAEPEWQHLDTGHGKRSAVLDSGSSAMTDLLGEAHVVVLGYRPASVARLGLSPESLAERHPGLVIAQLSAWGVDEPERRGFDSLVQAESGIAMVESPDGTRPGVLPAQALDHGAGYLLAASVLALLERRRVDGGTWIARTSLRRIAAELLGLPRRSQPDVERIADPAPHTAVFDVGGRDLRTVRPALPGFEFRAPHPWGGDQPRW